MSTPATPPVTSTRAPTPAVTSAPVAGSSTASPTPSVGTCATGQLSGRYVPGEGAGGQYYSLIALVNTGSRPCTLSGFPGVSLLDSSGRQIGPAAIRRSDAPYATVRLVPGKAAGITISTGSTAVPTRSHCQPVTATRIRVYPPGQYAALLVPASLPVCSSDTGLTTGPVRAGTQLQP